MTSTQPKRPGSLLALTLACVWALPAAVEAAEATLVSNGNARAEIVVAAQPTRSARLASRELQTYLEKISGAKLPIVTTPTDSAAVKIYVGASDYARALGVTAEKLPRDAFRIVSGDDWLALVGRDGDFTPIEPWAKTPNEWLKTKEQEWEALAGHAWRNPIGAALWRNYNKQLDVWNFDHRGSLNAVYEFLRMLGVRWYMPGELGEIVPQAKTIPLTRLDRTVRPAVEVRSIDRPLISSNAIDDPLWYLRLGLNDQYGTLHHGQREITDHPRQRAAHPEYYALLPNGKRDTERALASPCLSSEGLFREMVQYVRLMFDQYHLPIVSIMPEDGFALCQCDQCRPQGTLDRDASGIHSDYVWKFAARVASEVAKTHPDRKVFCGAYSSYRLPPRSIDKLPDNLLVQITNGRPIRELDDAMFEQAAELRRAWQAKTNNPLSFTLNFTPFTNRGEYRPQYWPHVIARGLREAKGQVWREDVWGSTYKGGLHYPGMSHLNYYCMSRLWWDPDQDVDALLAEYYRLFYGPAAAQMKAFIEFCEVNYAKLGGNTGITAEALSLFDQAKSAAPAESVYARRIALVEEFLPTLRNRLAQISQPRPKGLPEFRVIDMADGKWRDARTTLVLDGKLDEPFWTCHSDGGLLKDAETGSKPKHATEFQARWWNNNLYFGIRCHFDPSVPPVIGAGQSRDPSIWNGEHVELLIETDKHSYYQIVVNPAGAEIDLDRAAPKSGWFSWSSQSRVAAHLAKDYWSVEIQLPITTSDEDPLHEIAGTRPFKANLVDRASGKGSDLPWHFNLCRKRAGIDDAETTTFSPLGAGAQSFHDTMRFAELFTR